MISKLNRFLRDKRGAFAMQFALMVIPLLGCTGLAIDGGRAFLTRMELAAALDAGALAIGSNTSTDKVVLKAVAQKFVDANLKSLPAGSVTLTLDTGVANNIKLRGDVNMDTYFMPLLGVPHVAVAAESTVVRGGNNVEVALALDITESMSGSKVTALRTAAKNLVDTVVNTQQTPYFSKVALVPWGTNVHVSATYADALRGAAVGAKTIASTTWKNGSSKTMAGTSATPPGASWKNGAAFTTVNKITKVSSKVQLTFSANPTTLANGDYIYISAISSPSNNSYATPLNGKKFIVADKTTSSPWTMNLKDASSGNYTTAPSGSNNATNGTVQECYNAACEIQITTTSSPGVSAGNWVYISGTGGMTSINNTIWTVGSTPAPSGNSFMLSGSDGPGSSNYSSAGTVQKCFTATCQIQVTSTGHTLSDGDYTTITGASVSAINATWAVESVTANTFLLVGSAGQGTTDSTGGTSQCLYEGCTKFRFTSKANTVVTKTISNCVTERVGTDKYTDAAPAAGSYLGRDYPGAAGTLVECNTANSIIPMTSNKTTLKTAIDNMAVTGSTAGQIGTAWGWYMISPNWAPVWPNAENKPLAYGTKDLVKVVVLMTDGDFNTGHCKGVTSNNYAYSTVADADRINCASTNGEPFTQAKAICDGMHVAAKKIVVYTVGFQLTVQAAKDFMVYCATDPQHAYLAENNTELQSAFNSIATSISQLRIAK